MDCKKVLTALFLLFACFLLNAQSAEEPADSSGNEQKNYFIKEDKSGAVLYQKLSWQPVEDIFAFEFTLEKKDSTGKWKQIDKKNLKTNYTNVSLPPGKYRFKVAVINFLKQLEEASEYRNFDIRIAYQPKLESVSPKTIYFDEFKDDFITVSGKNFHEETEFILKKKSGGEVKGEIAELDKNGKKARITFNMSKVSPGEYNLAVIDPSGLNDEKEMIFKFQKPFDAYISAGYAFAGFFGNQIFKTSFGSIAPAGGIFRLTLVPIKRHYGHFGFNISLSGMQMKKEQKEFVLKGGFIFLGLNASYIYPIIKNRLNFDFHIGGGYAFLVNTQFTFMQGNIKSPSYWYWGMTFNTGTAFQVYMYKRLYAEINLEHIAVFRKDFPKYVIQPAISIGWEF